MTKDFQHMHYAIIWLTDAFGFVVAFRVHAADKDAFMVNVKVIHTQ